jgi:hypothetical protein
MRMGECDYIYKEPFRLFIYKIYLLKRKYYFLERPRIIIEKVKEGIFYQVYPKESND